MHMLRLFKVTSPMSVGSWLLGLEGALVTVAAAHEFLGVLPRVLARLAGALAGVLGMPVATYTAALVANTAVPVWHEARHTLPFAFAAHHLTYFAGICWGLLRGSTLRRKS